MRFIGIAEIQYLDGNQYTHNYTAAIMELLIKAGYEEDTRIEREFSSFLSIRRARLCLIGANKNRNDVIRVRFLVSVHFYELGFRCSTYTAFLGSNLLDGVTTY